VPQDARKKQKKAASNDQSSLNARNIAARFSQHMAGSSSVTSVVSSQQAQQGLGAFSPSDNTPVVVLHDSTCGGQHSSFFSGGRQHFDSLKRRREGSPRCSIRPFCASHSHTVQCF
jgi:hypothetical protein